MQNPRLDSLGVEVDPTKLVAGIAAFTLRWMLLTVLLASPSAGQLHAQATPEVEQVFKSSSRLVALDLVVTDSAERPVKNLSRQDFTILEDGVPQRIATFDPPPLHVKRQSGLRSTESADELGSTPLGSESRALTILVLDELNSEVIEQAYARIAIQKYLNSQGPVLAQPTSMMVMGQKRLELLHDYSRDAGALLRSLQHRHAELPFSLMHAELTGMGERFGKTLWALQQIAAANDHFAGRKNVIWIGPGFPAVNSETMDWNSRQTLQKAVTLTTNLLFEARLSVYTLDSRGLQVTPYWSDATISELIFESVATATGGRIFTHRNSLDEVIEKSSDEGAAYYGVGYYPTNHDWDGKFRKIQIVARGKGLQVIARKGYFAVADTTPTDEQIDSVLSRAVMSPLTYRSLDVHAAFIASAADFGRFSIEVGRRGLDWKRQPDGKRRSEVTVATVMVESDDRVAAQKVRQLEVLVDDDVFEKQWDKPVVFSMQSPMPRDTTHVRIAVRDAENGHIGTVDLPRELPPVAKSSPIPH
jgi:VWFA-related protein